ncbi:uncharacterized protein LOC133815415 [Humulus lupulus]|uniref:uncharacterized protein LOC133815415 n=1 Tax=Humulus lupulus TaxID=3486 RepID=UPI002B4045DD|nr:uncharacterized protein LOC133815415 [Humulus lupulus]
MAFPSNSQNNMLEGLSTTRAPFFNGVDFPYWKIRMETYLQSIDYDLWHIVSNGPYIPKHVINDKEVIKTYEAYDEEDKKMLSKNAKAKYALICGLDRDVFKNIEQASTAYDMWKMLEVTHQGTNAMKETKIQIYSTQYENFKMKADETIANMYTRFTTITNGLNSLGKVLSQKEMVTKILRSLTKAYQGKVIAIQEAKDLSTLPLEELIGSLMNHLDSGCSKHMTGDPSRFSSFKSKESGFVTFGDNSKGKILGIGDIGNIYSPCIKNVLLVDNLKHNLLSISQLCDKDFRVVFESSKCSIENASTNEVIFVGERKDNVYVIDVDSFDSKNKCLTVMNDNSWLWHRRLGHASMDSISKLVRKDLVVGLSSIPFVKDKLCDACQFGKQIKTSFHSKKEISTSRPLQLLHIDLFGPSRIASLGGKYYAFVIVDDFSRFTWVIFLKLKNDVLENLVKFCKSVQNEKGYSITSIRSDHGGEFDNDALELFCDEHGFNHNFSAPRTPQQNGVVERKNRTIQEMARSMLNEISLPKYFWAEAVNTSCYILNRVFIRPNMNKTPYELWKGRKPNIGYFRVFGCKCYILNTKDNLGKFDAKSDVGIFIGYSTHSKAYRIYNKRTNVVEESIHVAFDLESIRMLLAFACHKNFVLYQMDVKSAFLNGYIMEEVYVSQPPGFQDHKHPNHVYKLKKALYGLKQAPRAWYDRLSTFLISNGFSMGKADNTLFIKRKSKDIIIVQIYVDDIIFGATNDVLCEEFSKCMHSEFEMSMMGELNFFLGLQIKQQKNGIFISQSKYIKDLLQKFDLANAKSMKTPMSTSIKMDKDESGKDVDITKYRGMIGSLLYLTASRPDILFSVGLCARYQSCPKESHLSVVKRIFRYLIGTMNLGLWYPKNSNFEIISYSDADFAGCKSDRKSTSGTCHFLGNSLVSWFSKKQNSVALSTTEAEYIAAGSCCAQILWMKQTLKDFDVDFECTPIKCDNTSAINLSKNPILHSRAKHIDIRHHFLRDHIQRGDIMLDFVSTNFQLADIFTKPLSDERFSFIRRELGMTNINEI